MVSTMLPPTFSSRLYFRVCCLVLMFVAASASFSGYYQKWHFAEADVAGDDSWAGIEAMLDGTAHRPSVYRRLLPATANWLDRVAPQKAKTSLENWQASDEDKLLDAISASPTASDPQYSFRYLAMYGLTFLCALLAVVAMYLVCGALEVPMPGALVAPVILILLVPYLMAGGGFFYDYPELAFFALAVWIALRFEWWWLIPIVALGTWNKETFLLFVVTLYPLLRRNSSRRAAAVRIGALCAVSLAVLIPIYLRFAQNPGGGAGDWWAVQLHFYLNARNMLFASEETYGVRMFSAFTLLPVALLVWTAVRGWKYLPAKIRQHARIAAAINIPLYFIFCNPGELRNLSMLYVALLVLIATSVNRWPATERRT
ncbi:MAG: hypothetical protein M3O31_00155 [Acidobacteriota bacterium]|nr:hypothetical protein [Acidobacteriota bacterium]